MAEVSKLTNLQRQTLALVRDGKVSEQNTGYGSWRIFGGSPGAVGRLLSLGLVKKRREAERRYAFLLTESGAVALAVVEGGSHA